MSRALAIATLVAAAALAPQAHAFDITREELPEVYHSAAFLGRGDTGIAVADYEDALFYNPAGLALYDRTPSSRLSGKASRDGLYKRAVLVSPAAEVSQAAVGAQSKVSNPDADPVDVVEDVLGHNLHAGASNFTGLVLRRFGLGVVTSASADALVYKSPELGGLEAAAARVDAYAGAVLGGGQELVQDRVFLGVTGRYMERGRGMAQVDPTMSGDELRAVLEDGGHVGRGRGLAGDVGVMARTAPNKTGSGVWRLWGGATVKDVGTTRYTPTSEPSLPLDVKQTLNLGIGADFQVRNIALRLLADYRDAASAYAGIPAYQKASTGAELWLTPMLGIQSGLHDGYACYGGFIDFVLLRIDGGVYVEEMGRSAGARPDRRYFARVLLGL